MNADPVSTTAAVSADWMQPEYERFNAYQLQQLESWASRRIASVVCSNNVRKRARRHGGRTCVMPAVHRSA